DARCLRRGSRAASAAELLRFHTPRYLDLVRTRSAEGCGALDAGDTPAWRGCYETAAQVVGATLNAATALLSGQAHRAFVPIAGLHHAVRDSAAGFCIFNDCGVLIETLREAGIDRVAYVDIDAHHGDGVFYPFESDPYVVFADLHEDGRFLYPGTGHAGETGTGAARVPCVRLDAHPCGGVFFPFGADPYVVFADLHEDGRFLYPGTGHAGETGTGAARGTKLNIPLPPGADDAHFNQVWPQVLTH